MDYIKLAKAFYIFYLKILIPTVVLSALMAFLGFAGTSFHYLHFVGIGIIFFSPLLHYLTYELRNTNEYFFYFNQGLSKTSLWILSSITSFLIGLIFIFSI